MKKKDMYVSPQVEVIEMENEGTVMSASVAGMGNNTWGSNSSSRSTYSRSSASSSDLEDMINDILTIEN